jgi:hypothetical protein
MTGLEGVVVEIDPQAAELDELAAEAGKRETVVAVAGTVAEVTASEGDTLAIAHPKHRPTLAGRRVM